MISDFYNWCEVVAFFIKIFKSIQGCVYRKQLQVIVLIRNPKDQVVSWYHFTKGPHFDLNREYFDPDWTQFYSDYIAGKVSQRVTVL